MITIASRIYNEESIIQDFIDHYRDIADGGFYFYDDGSDDSTLDILANDPAVKHVIKGKRPVSSSASHNAQNSQRQQIIAAARKDMGPEDYLMLLDADDFLYFDIDLNHIPADVLTFDAFDLYITEEDKDKPWQEREYVGPEFRTVIMAIKNKAYRGLRNDRTILTNAGFQMITPAGYLKHVGKAVSVDYWERKCAHYSADNMPTKYKQKWELRKGKAIHKVSDFNRPLLKWQDLKNNKTKMVDITA